VRRGIALTGLNILLTSGIGYVCITCLPQFGRL